MSKKKQIIIVDGDICAFRISCACEKRSVLIKHLKSSREKEFNTRTELKKLCESKGIEYKPEDYSFTDVQTAEPESYARATVKRAVEKIKRQFPDAELLLLVQGEGNHRLDLPLPVQYKSSRDDLIRPVHLSACKDQLVKLGARLSRDMEVDDLQIIKGYEFQSQGYDVILATSDKDARAYTGLKIWDFTKDDAPIVEIGDLGYLEETPQGVKGQGFLWYCQQMQNGDPVDAYRPTDLTEFSLGKKVKFGEKSAYKNLKDCATKQQAWNVVASQYKKWFPEPFTYTCWKGEVHENTTYKDVLKLYHKCVRMKSTQQDELNLFEFLQQEGVKFEEENN